MKTTIHTEDTAVLRDLTNNPVIAAEATGPFQYVCPTCDWRSATSAGRHAATEFGKFHNEKAHGVAR